MGAARSAFIFAAYLIAQLLVGGAAGLVLAVAGATDLADDPAVLVLLGAAGLAAGAVAVWQLTLQTFDDRPRAEALKAVGLNPVARGQIGRGVLLGLGISLVSAVIFSRWLPPGEEVMGPLAEAATTPGWHRWVWTALVLLLAPAIEEFVFRGVLLTGMASAWGQRSAGIVVTVIFTLLHLSEAHAYLPALLPIFVIGWVTYRLRFSTGSILPGLAVHMSYNGLLVYLVLNQTGSI
ncbi:MAG: CPBP family intramembrane glutamic endopeptidase [Actinomycetota bacterium]